MIAANFMGEWKDSCLDFWRDSAKLEAAIIAACQKGHTVLALTKQYDRGSGFWEDPIISKRENFWNGFTICNQDSAAKAARKKITQPRWISFEPLLGKIKRETLEAIGRVDQIVVGAQTRPTIIPYHKWVRPIVEFAADYKIPVFIKDNLYPEDDAYVQIHNLRQLAWAKEARDV